MTEPTPHALAEAEGLARGHDYECEIRCFGAEQLRVSCDCGREQEVRAIALALAELRAENAELRGGWRQSVLQKEVNLLPETEAAVHIAELQDEIAKQSEDVRILLRGFDEGIFVRSIERDKEPGWAVILLPYLAAMRRLYRRDAREREEKGE